MKLADMESNSGHCTGIIETVCIIECDDQVQRTYSHGGSVYHAEGPLFMIIDPYYYLNLQVGPLILTSTGIKEPFA